MKTAKRILCLGLATLWPVWSFLARTRNKNHRLYLPHSKHGTALRPSVAMSSSFSPFDAVLKMAIPGKRNNGMESGFEAALILTDKKRQEDWKKDTRNKFPLVPGFVIDVCIDSLSGTFSSIAPAEVQAALRPGGLEKVRPGMEAKIVTNLELQPVVKGMPMTQADKRQFLQYLTKMSLDYVLKDAELALAKPSVKLQALDEQKNAIKKYMTFRQLMYYRIKTYPVQTMLVGVASCYIGYNLYNDLEIPVLISSLATAAASMITGIQSLWKKLAKSLGFASKKKIVRRAVRR